MFAGALTAAHRKRIGRAASTSRYHYEQVAAVYQWHEPAMRLTVGQAAVAVTPAWSS